jgi:hypothetical protein
VCKPCWTNTTKRITHPEERERERRDERERESFRERVEREMSGCTNEEEEGLVSFYT